MTDQLLPCPFCGHDPMRVLVSGMRDTISCVNLACPLFTVYLYPGDWNTRAQPASEPKRDACTSCDGLGDYHDATGEWRGYCTCEAGVKARAGNEQ
jgi:hypothetical protein